MKDLNQIRKRDLNSFEPEVFSFKKASDSRKVGNLIRHRKIISIVDEYSEQLKELDLVKNPKLIAKPPKKYANDPRKGKWVYYPWSSSLVHVLDKENYIRLKTSRNENLIFRAEQKKFANFRVGIAGLNVGNPAAVCLVLEGGGLNMKFADNDILALSNFNRFRASITDLGLNKAILSARQVYEINPYLNIEVYSQGLSPGNIDKFLLKPRIDVLIEEMDNLPFKILIREKARQYKIPVVMVTGNGENLILDVERFDLSPRLRLLNGFLKENIIRKIKSPELGKMVFKEKVFLARDFMGVKYLTPRLRKSFLEIGSKLAGIPQLVEASFLRGAVLCYVVRQIATGEKFSSGRYHFGLKSLAS